MKTRIITTSLVFAVCQSFTGSCLALTPVEENFNAAALNTKLWQLAQFENAKLRQSNKRLNFTVGPKTAAEDYAYLELRNNQPGFNENWQVVLDVTNTAGFGDIMGIGFWIYNADDPSDVIFFEFYGNKTKRSRIGVSASFVLDGIATDEDLVLKPKVTTSGKLKITFSARTKLFTFEFGKRVPKASGNGTTLVWQRVGTFSPTGKGGDARENWNMNPASGRFGIRLEGYGEYKLVGAGKAHMDNFVLKAVK